MDALEFSIFFGVRNPTTGAGLVAATGTVTVVDYTQLSEAVLTVGEEDYTEGVDWTAETSNEVTAANLSTTLETSVSVTPSVTGAVITLTAQEPGVDGNLIALATTDAVNLAISGDTLTGGSGEPE